MFRRHHAVCALAALAVIGLSTAGCSEDEQATPRVTFESQVTSGNHPPSGCRETGPWFDIGSFGNSATGVKVEPIDDGGEFGQGTVSVTCSVVGSGDGFDVKATASLSGATGGSVTITGFMRPQGDQADISMVFSASGKATYVANTKKCVVKYAQPLQTVAAGRVWGDFECEEIRNESQDRTCAARGQFRFENCGQ